jgi:F0F1-type ATP synthase membrane subunit c/vacuolar-type H+-ATPase subunit K
MELLNPQEIEARVEARFRVFLILWGAILVSVGFLMTLGVVLVSKGTPNPILSFALVGIGLTMVAVSFVLKQNLVRQAIARNDAGALQVAHILALALCESAALFGLVDRFITTSMTSWFLFAISVAGISMNFPSKEQIRSVSYKTK